jgi:hypothetical protein
MDPATMSSHQHIQSASASAATTEQPPSINDILEQTFVLINAAKKNKTHINKFAGLIKQIVKALSGVEYNFVLQAEFYSDLKETLYKIYCHIVMCMNRQKVVQLMMSKKDNQLYLEMQTQIDVLCGRIFLAYACRMTTRRRNTTTIPPTNWR